MAFKRGVGNQNCDFIVPSTVSAMQQQFSKMCKQHNVNITNCLFGGRLVWSKHELTLNTLNNLLPNLREKHKQQSLFSGKCTMRLEQEDLKDTIPEKY